MKNILLIITVFFLSNCTSIKDDTLLNNQSGNENNNSLANTKVPTDFNYATTKELSFIISSTNLYQPVTYKIYAHEFGGDKVVIGSGLSNNDGQLTLIKSIPNYINTFTIEKYYKGYIFEEKIQSTSDNVYVSFDAFSKNLGISESSNARVSNGCSDQFYGVNTNGEIYIIDVNDTFSSTQLGSNLSHSTFACGVDKNGGIIYYNNSNKLYKYTIGTGISSLIGSNSSVGWNYVKMAYHNESGRLFAGATNKLRIVNPSDYSIYRTMTVSGFNTSENAGGDLVFTSTGKLYNVSSSGLYLYTFNADTTTCTATRISADNFPYTTTGIAVDRFDNIYITTNETTYSKIIKMDPGNGAYQEVKDLSFRVHDLGNYYCLDSELSTVDSDNDGVIDDLDKYPNDANKAYNNYSPSELGYSSLAFEDLYPSVGDYDFNDIIINYRMNLIANADNKIVSIEAEYIFKYVQGTELTSGFGVQLPIHSDSITSVTGSFLTTGLINVDSKGLETGHSTGAPVYIVFDNSYGMSINSGTLLKSAPINITIDLSAHPIPQADLSDIPFNPFIFINKDRTLEVHLAGKSPTAKFDTNHRNSGEDVGTFKTSDGHPWAIHIPHLFHPSLDGVDITNSYHQFSNFASSGGSSDSDWFNDDTGHRNNDNIIIDTTN
ncbi:LruC domain-containing protein [Flammeovirga kamogawensis]|uniref:LruC domain-containing protein n=1 Tax=Flammeovirga kamogawensis TaxID=373891 RepID=A0ABX8H2A0_9BACT|nr:LruC domain-containing protein [Flammeovirga kamogawensis]MBB6460224.1 LruC domain-containing protein [Flammeovirga kamogawensis]QWG10036.1 LruC domain-containing protein [Flammeovirga kamogawensis]TRX65543.1 LruC domain-containing protein [Flammeovirga kamogawensis]